MTATSGNIEMKDQTLTGDPETDRIPARVTALIVTRYFRPESHSGTIRIASLCQHLPGFGVRPIVLTDQPDETAIRQATAGDERDVIRFPWFAINGATGPWLRKIPVLAAFVHKLRRARVSREALGALSQLSAADRPDLVFASSPSGDALVLGATLSRHFQVPFIADYRDPWSHWPNPLYPHAVDFLAERSVERATVRQCNRIVTTCEAARTILLGEFGTDAERIVVVPNGYDEQEFANAADLLPRRPDLFTIVYSGAIRRAAVPSLARRAATLAGFGFDPLRTNFNARSLHYFLEGLRRFYKRTPAARGRVRLCLVGAENTKGDSAVESFPYPELLEFYPRVSPELAIGACLQADLLLLTQLETTYDGKPLCVAIPAKLYSYLRSGRRILACAQRSEISELIAAESAGVTVPPQDPEAMANALHAEFTHWSGQAPGEERSLRDFQRYERREIARQIAQVMEDVLAEATPRVMRPAEAVVS